MSTAYRVVVTCDAQRTTECQGLLEVTRPWGAPAGDGVVELALRERGWARIAGPAQTHDVCPACRAAAAPAADTEHDDGA